MANPDLNEAQRWILALPAVLHEANDVGHSHLGGAARPIGSADAANILRQAWDLRSAEQCAATVERLLSSSSADLRAWDLGRAAAVAGWAYLAYLVDADTAWGWTTRAAGQLQASFPSWAAYGESYLRGRDAWRGRRPATAEDEEPRTIVARLLSSRESPWVVLPWSTKLDGARAPVVTPRTLLVDAGAKKSGYATIEQALGEAEEGDRIVVRAGVYDEMLVFEKSVELVAEGKGEVVLEGDDGPLVTVDDVGVLLHGITVRTRKPKGKKPGTTAVHASGGFLRLERCTVTGAQFGIDLLDADADVQLDGSRVVSCGSVGVIVEGGAFVARDSRFEGNAGASLQIAGESRGLLVRSKLLGATGAGLHLDGEAEVELDGCEIADNAGAGVLVRGASKVTIRGCTMRDNAFAHVELGSSGDALVADTRMEGGTGYGVHVLGESKGVVEKVIIRKTALACVCVTGGRPTLRSSSFSGSGQSGLFVTGGAGALVTDCLIEDNGTAGVNVTEGADPELVGCTIKGSGGDALLVQESGRGRFARCLFTMSTDAGVRLLEKAEPVLTGCRIEGNVKDGVVVGQKSKGRFLRCEIANNELGVYVAEGSAPTLHGCHVHGHKDDGIVVKNASLALEDCELDDNELNLRLEGAKVAVARCLVHHGRSTGVFCGDGTKGRIEDCDVFANIDAGIEVAEGSDPTIARCHAHDNVNADLHIHDKGRGTFEDGAAGGGNGWAVLVEGASRPKLVRMKIRDAKKGAISQDAKSKAVLEQCEMNAGEGFVIAALARPAGLAAKLARIDELLAATSAETAGTMKGGASSASLATLSTAVFEGGPLRDDVAAFFQWHDGQSKVASVHPDDNRTPMSIDEAVEAWTFLCDPTEEVQQPWSATWLPLLTNGAGDYLCVETAGDDAGTLVEYWHADEDRKRRYEGLDAWANEVIAALEKRQRR
jgi:nitrous oxidase accessory protein NosD/cell wall assembly regulator SMI1